MLKAKIIWMYALPLGGGKKPNGAIPHPIFLLHIFAAYPPKNDYFSTFQATMRTRGADTGRLGSFEAIIE